MTIRNTAIRLALEAHQGDRNKHDGELYLLHVARVAALVEARGGDDVDIAVAWLHDTVEDTILNYDDITQAFLPYLDPDRHPVLEIVEAVRAITKVAGESNNDYYHRVKLNPVARRVKLCDMHDNFSRNHLVVDPETAARLAKKYSLGMMILGEAT